jgi:hypothetical protein
VAPRKQEYASNFRQGNAAAAIRAGFRTAALVALEVGMEVGKGEIGDLVQMARGHANGSPMGLAISATSASSPTAFAEILRKASVSARTALLYTDLTQTPGFAEILREASVSARIALLCTIPARSTGVEAEGMATAIGETARAVRAEVVVSENPRFVFSGGTRVPVALEPDAGSCMSKRVVVASVRYPTTPCATFRAGTTGTWRTLVTAGTEMEIAVTERWAA